MREPAADNEQSIKSFLTAAEIRDLWLTRMVSEQCATGNGDLIELAAAGPSNRFKFQELGLHPFEHPSILKVQQTLRATNRGNNNTFQRNERTRYEALLARARKEGLRALVEAPSPETGCSGCPSCVPETRSRPRRSREPSRRRDWLPYRSARAKVMSSWSLEDGELRQLSMDPAPRSGRRSKAARAQIKARRAEQRQVERAIERALENVTP